MEFSDKATERPLPDNPEIEEIDNTARFSEGELIGAKLFDHYIVAIIRGVEVKRKILYELNKEREKAAKGKDLIDRSIFLNTVWYVTDLGKIKESGILHLGMARVNEHIKSLEEGYSYYADKVQEIKSMCSE